MKYIIEIKQNDKKKLYELEMQSRLYFKGTISDLISIKDGKAYLIKKIGINKLGETYLLPQSEVQELYSNKKIELFRGENEVRILNQRGRVYVKYALDNDLNNVFATRVELKSEIKQASDSINLEVSKKVGNNEIISKINQTPEKIGIQANKLDFRGKIFNLTTENLNIISTNFRVDNNGNVWANNGTFNGTINATSGTIGGWNINQYGLYGNGRITGGQLDIATKEGYLKVGLGLRHPEVSGLNVKGAGVNLNGLGINNENGRIRASGGLISHELKAEKLLVCNEQSYLYGTVHLNNIEAANKVLIKSLYDNIELEAKKGTIYAWGGGLANGKVRTDEGLSSSKSVKKHIKKFTSKRYDKALNLLKNINIYDYEYKYGIYKDFNQYGFLIDEIEKYDNNDFFKLEERKAIVNKKEIDFNCEKDKKGKLINVKKYDSDVLDKYMLTCLKALQNELEQSKNEIKELRKELDYVRKNTLERHS